MNWVKEAYPDVYFGSDILIGVEVNYLRSTVWFRSVPE